MMWSCCLSLLSFASSHETRPIHNITAAVILSLSLGIVCSVALLRALASLSSIARLNLSQHGCWKVDSCIHLGFDDPLNNTNILPPSRFKNASTSPLMGFFSLLFWFTGWFLRTRVPCFFPKKSTQDVLLRSRSACHTGTEKFTARFSN
jgi:hypothetical protein